MSKQTYFTITKINDQIYQFNDQMSVLATLVIGTKKALLFDTCYGIGDLKKAVEEITLLPLIVVNSHGHIDHANGNYQFNEVYLHIADFPLCQMHTSDIYRKKNIRNAKLKNILPFDFNEESYLHAGSGNLKVLDVKRIIDLGDLHLEVIEIPGHTLGSIALYLKELKIMLVSDGACPYVWLFLPESATLPVYIASLKKLLTYDFDSFLVGHGAGLLPKSFMERFLKVAEEIDITKSISCSFESFDYPGTYAYSETKLYDPGHCGIVYNINKMK